MTTYRVTEMKSDGSHAGTPEEFDELGDAECYLHHVISSIAHRNTELIELEKWHGDDIENPIIESLEMWEFDYESQTFVKQN